VCYILQIIVQDSKQFLKTLIASSILHVSMNIMVTFLIVLQLTRARLAVSEAFPEQPPSRMYANVAAIIIESAAPLAFFGIGFIIVTAVAVYHTPKQLVQEGRLNVVVGAFDWIYCAFCVSPRYPIPSLDR
jgi:hypothetical protein